ncbi:ABC transporter ATP-binding protein, partial [bacterium AH-315-E10]|nr:ABC transporter ATP-binding protein [bacterium AH-315-E10]
MVSENLLCVSSLSFSYGSERVLDDICFNVRLGETIAIVGPNGSGKSTLLKIIMRVLQHDSSILLQGTDLQAYSQGELARIITYVPQQMQVEQDWTVREFVAMSRYPHRSAFQGLSSQDQNVITEAIMHCDLGDYEDRFMNQLSGGEVQRVLIASAMAQESELMLLDEITSHLDPGHQAALFVILKSLQEKGKTILSATHDLNAAAIHHQRIIAL